MNGNNRLTTEPATEIRAVIEQLRGLSPAQPAQDDADASAYKLGKYRILNALSVRGQAYVFLAYDDELERQVVIKLYHEGLDELQRQRLMTEGKALARISSPWVARCLAVEQFDGQPALVIEFVPGATLACTGPGQIEPWQAVKICSKIARGVAAVHEAGLLHRDLKPSNVILMDDAEPRIIDFGLTQLVGDPENCDSSGTPAFMPPERARHDFASIDERSDVFGVGAILYFLLAGSPPFAGESSQASRELARAGNVRPIRELKPGIDERLASLCMSCLERDVEARPSSARQLADTLEAMQDRLRVKPVSPTKIAMGIAALLIGLVAIGVTISRMGNTPETPGVASSTTDHAAAVPEDRAEQLLQHLASGEPEAIELRSDFELPWTLDGEVVQATASRPVSMTPGNNQYQIRFAPRFDCHLKFVVFQFDDATSPMTHGVYQPNRDEMSIDLQGNEPSPSNEYLYVRATEKMNRSIRVVREPSFEGPRIAELLIPFRVTATAAGSYAWPLELPYLELASQGKFDELLKHIRRQARDPGDPQPAELEKIVALDDESKSRLADGYAILLKASRVRDTGVDDLDALMRELDSAVATITELAGTGTLTSLRAMYVQFELLNYVGRRQPALQSIRKIFELLPENSPHRLRVKFDYAEVLGRKFLLPESDRLLQEVIDGLQQDAANDDLTPEQVNLLTRAKLRQAHNRRAAGKVGLSRSLFAELTELVRDDPRITDENKARVFEAHAAAMVDPRDLGPAARIFRQAAIHMEKAMEQETAADRRKGLGGYANSLTAQHLMMRSPREDIGQTQTYEKSVELFRQSSGLRDEYCHALMAFGQSGNLKKGIELISRAKQELTLLNGGPSLELNVVVDVLSLMYRVTGQNNESIAALEEQLDLVGQGPLADVDGRSVASLWHELGKSRYLNNEPELAVQCFRQSLEAYEAGLTDVLLFPDEVEIASFASDMRYVVGYLMQLAEYQTDQQVFNHLRVAKGVTRRLTAWRNRILTRPEYAEMRDQLTSIQQQISQHIVRTSEPNTELDRLISAKRELLTRIHNQLVADQFWEASEDVWQQLEEVLDPGTAVVEVFWGFDVPDSMRSRDATYYALIAEKHPEGQLQTKLVALGTVESVNGQLAQMSESTDEADLELEFWKTLAPELEGMHAVTFCPDGQMVSLSFAMTPGIGADSEYLINDMQVTYATSITDLAATLSREPVTKERKHLVVAGADYGPLVKVEDEPWAKEFRGSTVGYDRLTESVTEATAYMDSLGEHAIIEYLTGSEATEERLTELMPQYPNIYLITHGFARNTLRELMAEDSRSQRSRLPWAEYGLVLAGANQIFEPQNPELSPDQILTAQEIMVLDLSDVDLVTLSACL